MSLSEKKIQLKQTIFQETILQNPYLRHKPSFTTDGRSPQTTALQSDYRELLYGGACGGGKSDMLEMAGLQYVQCPNYNAIIFRKTFTDLSLAGALIPRAKEWLGTYLQEGSVKWDGVNHVFTFPTGSTLAFGYLEHEGDELRYKGAEFQFIGFDQVEEIPIHQYLFLHSRARRNRDNPVPVRIWSTANPDGYEWVKQRFLPWFQCPVCGLHEQTNNPKQTVCPKCKSNGATEPAKDEQGEAIGFVPAYLTDNLFLDREDYVKGLNHLDPTKRAQLLNGDWNVKNYYMFKRAWFMPVTDYPSEAQTVSVWDLAATKQGNSNDPDYTANCKATMQNGIFTVLRIYHARNSPGETEQAIRQFAKQDGYACAVYFEEERGAAGKNLVDQIRRNVLTDYAVYGLPPTGEKAVRAMPLASAAEAGNVRMLSAPWNTEFLNELEGFPLGKHDDMVDVCAYAYNVLAASVQGNVSIRRAKVPT